MRSDVHKKLPIVLMGLAAILGFACSDVSPTTTPVDANTVVNRIIDAMMGTSYRTESRSEWRTLNRATGEWRTGAEVHRTARAADGSTRQVTTFPYLDDPSESPVRRETRCVDGASYLLYEGFDWATPAAGAGECPDAPTVFLDEVLNVDWTSGPEHVLNQDDDVVLRMVGERLLTNDGPDGRTDATSFVLKTVRLYVDPTTFRILETETVTESYVGDDSWGIIENTREPISTYTTVTKYSDYGEPVVVEVPEGVE